MLSLNQLVRESSAVPLSREATDHLYALMSDWQVIADLVGADLVLWLPTTDGRFVAAALCRPATSSTVHVEDIIGRYSSSVRGAALMEGLETGQIVEPTGSDWAGAYSTSVAYIPVPVDGKPVAVISREMNVAARGNTVGHGMWTEWAGNVLIEMIARGEYPYHEAPTMAGHGIPRVIDGALLLDAEGVVRDMTPNANSCMRRLGIRCDLVGTNLGEAITSVLRDGSAVEETMAVVVMGRAPWRVTVEANSHAVNIRALPLLEWGQRIGAVLLTRDVSETHRREQELMTKDATIREIHHRVKNNLQTVSALLRMQSRRSDSAEVHDALHEAGRRVQAIATVHQALSQNVDEVVGFDEVARTVLRMAGSVASTDHNARVVVEGEFGPIPADAAAALATVLTELVTNSVEHGFVGRDGTVTVKAQRNGDSLTVVVEDDGVGIKEGRELSGLGTQIVEMMVKGELHGTIDWARGNPGTIVTLHLDVSE